MPNIPVPINLLLYCCYHQCNFLYISDIKATILLTWVEEQFFDHCKYPKTTSVYISAVLQQTSAFNHKSVVLQQHLFSQILNQS